MSDEFVVPDHFHVLWLRGQCFFIDTGTRREIEAFMHRNPGKCESITVDSIVGEEITVVAYEVSSIYDTSDEIRRRDAMVRKVLEGDSL